MDLKRVSLELLFHNVQVSQVIEHLKDNNHAIIDFEDFYNISLDRFRSYSKDEVEMIYQQCCESMDMNNCATFFFELGKYCNQFLSYNKYEPLVDYKYLMRWTLMYHLLGQDLLVCSYLAYHDYQYDERSDFFAYRSVIRTNNQRLHNILDQGMAENHFHLKGSTKIYEINWLSLMNHPFHREKEFKILKYRMSREKLYKQEKFYTLETLANAAAIIRMYLFLRINHEQFDNVHEKYKGILWDFLVNDQQNGNTTSLINIMEQGKNLVSFHKDRDLDYALKAGIGEQNFTGNKILVGERRLLYECIFQILNGKLSRNESILLYLYILIKNKFRDEIIQINNRTGFENFSMIEQRKELFIENYPKYKDELIRLAVLNTCMDQTVLSLEARVAPKRTCRDNINMVRHLDSILDVKDGRLDIGDTKTEYFYVWHFVKKKEPVTKETNIPRNAKLRKEVEIQARALAEALRIDPIFRSRTRGIDTCNNEHFARPEVFAQAFRFLSNFSANNQMKTDTVLVPYVINRTYHAGEDFPDIVDGLRAIDEAILFCNLDNRCRIGHGVALGLDAQRYYEKKSRITFTRQSFLDNISWLYAKCMEYDISIETSYYNKINTDFQTEYRRVYKDYNRVTIEEYYDAWKLRGDEPSIYIKGSYQRTIPHNKYDSFRENPKVSSGLREDFSIAQLYYAYHYDDQVKKLGNQKYIFEVDCRYIHLVKVVQKKMQFDLARKGIMIECNPTSNFMISQLKRYEYHPIIQFYNYELSKREDDNCAQLCVSINTDDQGVFDTSLENEYALMAYSLENAKDENGNYLYTATEVYKWIDSIRKMGLQQKFK